MARATRIYILITKVNECLSFLSASVFASFRLSHKITRESLRKLETNLFQTSTSNSEGKRKTVRVSGLSSYQGRLKYSIFPVNNSQFTSCNCIQQLKNSQAKKNRKYTVCICTDIPMDTCLLHSSTAFFFVTAKTSHPV